MGFKFVRQKKQEVEIKMKFQLWLLCVCAAVALVTCQEVKSAFEDITEAGFKAVDLDEDGFLSFSEMIGQSREQLKETDPKEANAVFDGMDSDKDGKITLDEWKKKIANDSNYPLFPH